MKPNNTSGAGKHDATGVPTGLDRKARRAVHAARDEYDRPQHPFRVGAILSRADKILDQWTEGKLERGRIMRLTDDAYRQIRNRETDPDNDVTPNYGRPFGP